MAFTPTVELLIDGIWTDITSDVRQADGIQITRGRSGEGEQVGPSICSLTLDNRSGNYSPRNPTGAYYGKIGRNTQLRVKADNGSARFYGEVSGWAPRWDKTGRDTYVPIEAAGVLRRLGQGAAALRSTLYRGLTTQSDVVGYWPCEDGEDATEFASGLPGHPSMKQFYGTSDAASFDGFAASAPLPLATGAAWQGIVPAYTVTGKTQVSFLLAIPSGGVSVTSTLAFLRTTGTAQVWTLSVNAAGDLRLQAFNSTDVQIADSGFFPFAVNGKLLRVSIELDATPPGDVDWAFATLEVGKTLGAGVGGTLVGRTIGRIKWLTMNANVGGVVGLDDVAMGHVSVHNDIGSIYDLSNELKAYDGERARVRFLRLCIEEGITPSSTVSVDDTAKMGPQVPATLLDLLNEAADADGGVLFEPRAFLGLQYRPRSSMYAQDAELTLDYSTGAVSSIEPVEDDDALRNDVTVSRVNGSSARAQLETGPLSVNAPPDGVGLYADEVSISLSSDGDLPDQAGWRLHLGTVDEARYPVLGMNLAHAAFTGDALLTGKASTLNIGDRLVVTGAPAASTSPEDIQQIAQGFTETLTPFEWLIDVNCTPASPWNVAIWDDDDDIGSGQDRYSSDGTTLASTAYLPGLVLDGTSPGRAATADDASLDITSDLDIRVHAALDDWTPTGLSSLVTKWMTGGGQQSWRFRVQSTTGTLMLSWSEDGSAALFAESTVAPTVTDGESLWVRVTLDVDNGAAGRDIKFYTSTDGVDWTQLGATVTQAGVTSIFDSTAEVNVGAYNNGASERLAGRVFSAQIRDGIDGTIVANPDFGAQASGTTSFADSTGKTWTVYAPGAISNVPMVPASGSALVLTGAVGSYATTPDTTALDITGDLDVRVHAALDDWTPGSTQTLASKWLPSPDRQFIFDVLATTGVIRLHWSTTGSNQITVSSTVAPTVSDGDALWVRATLDVDNGAAGRDIRFYTSTDGETWTQLGATVTTAGVTSIFAGTAPVEVGSILGGTANRLAGKISAVEIRDGIDGTVVARPEFGGQPAGTTSFVDIAGRTWTINAPATIADVDNTLFPDALNVDTPTGPVWSDVDAPFDIVIGGERMTVTDVTGTGAAQVFTVTRSVNDVRKGHAAGAEVELAKPAIYAL
jgi:hypothetical protein